MKPFPLRPAYLVAEDGAIYRDGRALKPALSKHGGYLQVSLWGDGRGKTFFVHQVVAITYRGPRPSPRHHAAHRDGNKLNNALANVEWITKEENEADKVRHGTSNRGERSGSAKITDAQASEILARVPSLPRSSGGVKLRKGVLQALAAEFGLSPSGVWQIINGYRRSAT